MHIHIEKVVFPFSPLCITFNYYLYRVMVMVYNYEGARQYSHDSGL